MASGDNRLKTESDFNKILGIVKSRDILQTALGASRPSCYTSDGGSDFNFCNQEFYDGPQVKYDYSSYIPERSNLAEKPDDAKLLALFRRVVPVLVYLGTSATRRISGYAANSDSKYGSIAPSSVAKSVASFTDAGSSFTQNSYFSYWFSLHPNVRMQILDVIVSLSENLGVDKNCVRGNVDGSSSACQSDRARALIRTVSALRQTANIPSIDAIVQQLRPDTNTSRPSKLLARSKSRGVAR
jgi:hypothetical protein